MSMSIWKILSLLATISLVSYASASEQADCGLSKPFQITTRAQLFEIANGASLASGPTCPEEISVAIKELNLIVDDNENICSQEKADRIRDFHTIYLANDKKRAVKLPKPVKQFFVGYALKVSQQCRKLAVDNLVSASSSLLKPEDFDVVGRFTDDKGLLAKLISDPSDQENLVLPRTMVKLLRSYGERVNQDKLFLQMSTIKTVGAMKRVCASKFKPIYEKLILPLVTLSSTGYNFQSTTSDLGDNVAVEQRSQASKQVFQWYRIVLLCELLENSELISANESGEKSNLIKILSKNEAEELKKTSPQLFFDGQGEAQEEAPINFEPSYSATPKIADLVIDESDKALIKKIKSFKNGNVVSRFLRKVGRGVKDQLSKSLMNLAISKNALVITEGKQVTSANDLVKVIDDYIYDEERQGETAVSDGRDTGRRVAWGIAFLVMTGIVLLACWLGGAFGGPG